VNSKRILVIIKLPLSVSYQYNEMERGVCGIVVQYWIVGVRYERSKNLKKESRYSSVIHRLVRWIERRDEPVELCWLTTYRLFY
jgi:hypothetical protein